ncbi:hypothetical protein LTS15_010539 [Exophiala xenobiotica]|nr:hypothetical protein LTS15_010539 [Exophiala xenobiotica]
MPRRAIQPEQSSEIDIQPGTIYVVDLFNRHDNLVHAGAKTGTENIILVPQPSDDPRDPLRWSRAKKGFFVAILCTYTLLVNGITLGVSTVFVDVETTLGATPLKMNAGTATQLIFLGIGNVLCTPLTLKFGRHPLYLGTLVVLLASQLLQMSMTNYGDFIGSYVLSGLDAAPVDVLVEISFEDFRYMFRSRTWHHDLSVQLPRGRRIICRTHLGAILYSILVFLTFFFLEESLFIRGVSEPEIDDTALRGVTNPSSKIAQDTTPTSEDKKGGATVAVPQETRHTQILTEPGKAPRHLSRLALWHNGPLPWNVVGKKIIASVTSVTYRAVWWVCTSYLATPASPIADVQIIKGGLIYGTLISWLTMMLTTEGEFFYAPPYNFSSSQIGLLSLAPLIGTLIAIPFPGLVNDRIVLALARRNKGYAEPEFRLWILIALAFLQAAGLLIYGFGVVKGMAWPIPCVGLELIGFGLVTGIGVLLSYVLDCYKEIAEEAITGVLVVRALWATGFTFAIQPWLETDGIQNTFVAMSIIALALLLSSVLLIKWGKALRRLTATRYIRASLETL